MVQRLKVKQEKQEKGIKGDPETGVHGMKGRSRGDPGKIHRSREFGVQECRKRGRVEGQGWSGILRVRGIEGDSEGGFTGV